MSAKGFLVCITPVASITPIPFVVAYPCIIGTYKNLKSIIIECFRNNKKKYVLFRLTYNKLVINQLTIFLLLINYLNNNNNKKEVNIAQQQSIKD